MHSFKSFNPSLSEGYNIFPKNVKELTSAIKDRPPEIQKDIKSLYTFLKKSHELPINLNAKEPNKVNVTRALQGTFDISDITVSYTHLTLPTNREV